MHPAPVSNFAAGVVMAAATLSTPALAAQPQWQATEWNGEQAFACGDATWRAVVSVPRARLVYFGLADGSRNLLFATPNVTDPIGWGGHRLWLGPQQEWPGGGWPPPAAWEKSRAAPTVDGARLRLALPESGGGWPRLEREYEWKDGSLLCRAHSAGGSHAAQFIHILQVPRSAVVTLATGRSPVAPRGFVQVHLGRHPSPQPQFPRLPQARELPDGAVELRFTGEREKLGFEPQAIQATIGDHVLRVDRGPAAGAVVTVPDDGFVTQVYLGGGADTLIELEQLSPLYRAGAEASFEVRLSASRGR